MTNKLENCYEYIRLCQGKDPKITLLKGGAYKIKGYYLENNNLNDIRGASVNLSYVEEHLIPQYIAQRYNADCIIYNGGGNIFCILPNSVSEDFAIELEKEARKYLITANTAYVVMESTIDEIKKNYQDVMYRLEGKLSERKKLKVAVECDPESDYIESGIPWDGNQRIKLNAKKRDCGNSICELCKSRLAVYDYRIGNSELKVCASCLHKHSIGMNARKTKYIDEYEKYTGKKAIPCNSLSDIDNKRIAVVYGDGNNMGQIIQNFNKITEMMEFSDKVKLTANKAVFETMKSLSIERFEVVGLGGDDVFVILSGKVAIDFAIGLIDRYNKEFLKSKEEQKVNKNPYKSTMSVGICVAKTNTPIRTMLEIAEDKLKEAKELAKRENVSGCDRGSLAFAVMDDPLDNTESLQNAFGAEFTLQPYGTEAAKTILEFTRKCISSDMGTTAIRNLYDAYVNSNSNEEAFLFYNYQNAKAKSEGKIPSLPNINGYILEHGLYYRDKSGKGAFIWNDILELKKIFD